MLHTGEGGCSPHPPQSAGSPTAGSTRLIDLPEDLDVGLRDRWIRFFSNHRNRETVPHQNRRMTIQGEIPRASGRPILPKSFHFSIHVVPLLSHDKPSHVDLTDRGVEWRLGRWTPGNDGDETGGFGRLSSSRDNGFPGGGPGDRLPGKKGAEDQKTAAHP